MSIENEKELNKLLGIKLQFTSWSAANLIRIVNEKVELVYSGADKALMFKDYIEASIPEELKESIEYNDLKIVISPELFNILHDQMINSVDYIYEGSIENSYEILKKELNNN